MDEATDAPLRRNACKDCDHHRRMNGVAEYCAGGVTGTAPAYGHGHPLRHLPKGGTGCEGWVQARWLTRSGTVSEMNKLRAVPNARQEPHTEPQGAGVSNQ